MYSSNNFQENSQESFKQRHNIVLLIQDNISLQLNNIYLLSPEYPSILPGFIGHPLLPDTVARHKKASSLPLTTF